MDFLVARGFLRKLTYLSWLCGDANGVDGAASCCGPGKWSSTVVLVCRAVDGCRRAAGNRTGGRGSRGLKIMQIKRVSHKTRHSNDFHVVAIFEGKRGA